MPTDDEADFDEEWDDEEFEEDDEGTNTRSLIAVQFVKCSQCGVLVGTTPAKAHEPIKCENHGGKKK